MLITNYTRYAKMVVDGWNIVHPALPININHFPPQHPLPNPARDYIRARIVDATRIQDTLGRISVEFDWAVTEWMVADRILEAFLTQCPGSMPNDVVVITPVEADNDGLLAGGITLRFY